MEQNVYRKATGVVAIIAAVLCIFDSLTIGPWWGMGYIGIFNYLSRLSIFVAMSICAVHVFVLQSQNMLFGVATAIFTGSQALEFICGILIVHMLGGYFIIQLLVTALITVIFLIITIQYFSRKKTVSKALPIIALVLSGTPIILNFLYYGYFYFLLTNIITSIYLIPFLLFLLGCPLHYKRISGKIESTHLQEQKMIVGDFLTSQLLYLKNDFDNGRITQQEYDYQRKSLIDEL